MAAVRKVISHLLSSSIIFFFLSGVFSGCDYGSNIALNHAIQLVGYGESPQMLIHLIYNCHLAGTDPSDGDYWLVRNSWGAFWGEHGYIRLQRSDSQTVLTTGI